MNFDKSLNMNSYWAPKTKLNPKKKLFTNDKVVVKIESYLHPSGKPLGFYRSPTASSAGL